MFPSSVSQTTDVLGRQREAEQETVEVDVWTPGGDGGTDPRALRKLGKTIHILMQ